MRTRSLALPFLIVAGAIVLAGCSAPSDGGTGGGGEPEPTTIPLDQPAWYGSGVDADGCPVPASGATIEPTDADAFLQTSAPANWCVYASTEYVQYYAVPAVSGGDFGGDVRGALEPAGWAFDAADDDSPQWSWITAYPEGSEEGFADGAVDGAIFTVADATQDDIDTYSIWFSGLPTAFGGAWTEGDEISVLGFW